MSDIHGPTPIAFWRSDLGNPQLATLDNFWRDILSDATFVRFRLLRLRHNRLLLLCTNTK